MKKNLLTALFALIAFGAFAQTGNVGSRAAYVDTRYLTMWLDTYCEADDSAKTNTVSETVIKWSLSEQMKNDWDNVYGRLSQWGPFQYSYGHWYEFRLGFYQAYKFDVYRVNLESGEEEYLTTIFQEKDVTEYEYSDKKEFVYNYGDNDPEIGYMVKATYMHFPNMVEMRRYDDNNGQCGALNSDGLSSYSATHQYTYYPAAEVTTNEEWFPAFGDNENKVYTSLWGDGPGNEIYYMCGLFFQQLEILPLNISGQELANEAYKYVRDNLAGKEDGESKGSEYQDIKIREYYWGDVTHDIMTVKATASTSYTFFEDASLTLRKNNADLATLDMSGFYFEIPVVEYETKGTPEYNGNYFGRVTTYNNSTWGFGPLSFDAVATGVETVGTDAATVVGANGMINILNSDAEVFVYSVNGQMIYSGMDREIACNAGLYIVKLGNKTYKVLLK